MGGQAFASGEDPLYTPRMSPAAYQHVLNYCHTKLRELFVAVATPIPGPAKDSYGDIDIFVTWEKNTIFPSSQAINPLSPIASPNHDILQAAAQLLNAKRHIREQQNVINLAIPWPDNLHEETSTDNSQLNGDAVAPRYIQVDLHLCDSIEQLQWMLVRNSHGGVLLLIGSTIRPYGLTLSEHGLYIRIPEIESLNKKQGKILLSDDPIAVFDFLGLDYQGTQWEEPFASVEELFEYAATCRFFWVRPAEDDGLNGGGEVDQSKMHSKERQTMRQHPFFRKWVHEFIPACRESGRIGTTTATRDSVRAEAFARFPGAQQAYETRLLEWRKEQQRVWLFRGVIKPAVPRVEGEEPSQVDMMWRSKAGNALKKIIMQDDYKLGIRPSTPLRDETGMYDEERVKQFVIDNWKQVEEAVQRADRIQCAKKKEAKEAKEAEGIS
ncbi:uncharacterized protein F4822DRAFT_92014 [Hypoxylon trugodes]|uniref:uncharacterized protein n=1 Tax=Hypoxylon trugodes TaxID=326681 RepID=UPI00219894D1|nr:uncharacterized protein F4822DRAFT_92014 [Hypoxylon trugodes]KAI1383086.1 hypothetical protein F4822DRAFT_92014 [Hypoxylon trugodes]